MKFWTETRARYKLQAASNRLNRPSFIPREGLGDVRRAYRERSTVVKQMQDETGTWGTDSMTFKAGRILSGKSRHFNVRAFYS